MSRENVEVVRSWCDAVSRGDLAAASQIFDPALEFRYPDEFPGGGTYNGLEGAGRALLQELEAWEDFEMTVEDLKDAGDHVVAAIRERGTGRTSGLAVDVVLFSTWTFSNAKVVRLQFFVDRAEALEAVGPRE